MSKFLSQRETINSALHRLGLHADENGFERLGQEVGTKGRTLYKAWLGNIKISERVRLALTKTGVQSPEPHTKQHDEQMRGCLEQLGFIYQNGSSDQTRLIEAMIESAYELIAKKAARDSAEL